MPALSPSDAAEFVERFHQQGPAARDLIELFQFLPSVYFYAKDRQHRYISVNKPVLQEVFGLESPTELLGRTDADFQPPALAEAYHAEDRRVMDGGKTIANQAWLVPHIRGTPRWYRSTKTPLRDPHSQVIGVAGVMYPITTPEEQANSFRELSPVIQHIDANYTEPISMAAMAQQAGLSATHFNQRFRELLRMSPTQYLLSRRVERARRLLTESDDSIAAVGAAVGFYDQSHFTKRFRSVTGITPRAYRKQFGS